jgi:hypothetical protein
MNRTAWLDSRDTVLREMEFQMYQRVGAHSRLIP